MREVKLSIQFGYLELWLITTASVGNSGPKIIKTFFMLNSAEHENFSANKYEMKMPTKETVGIFLFISRENIMLS